MSLHCFIKRAITFHSLYLLKVCIPKIADKRIYDYLKCLYVYYTHYIVTID